MKANTYIIENLLLNLKPKRRTAVFSSFSEDMFLDLLVHNLSTVDKSLL
jgi:hypothetical protein